MPGCEAFQPKLLQYFFFPATHESYLVFSLKALGYVCSVFHFTILSPFYPDTCTQHLLPTPVTSPILFEPVLLYLPYSLFTLCGCLGKEKRNTHG